MIKSPLNYPGNKSRIIKEIINCFPSKTKTFIEPFCGSSIISLNYEATYYRLNDYKAETTELTKMFMMYSGEYIVNEIDKIIKKYNLTNTHQMGLKTYPIYKHEGLSKHNKEAYSELRKDYNCNKNIFYLFALIIFGFNHYIRFNSKGEFNIPVGKTDFYTGLRTRTIETAKRFKKMNILVSNTDFRDYELYNDLDEDDLVYFDPPYLITDAPYNISWNIEDERNLLNLCDKLNENGVRFALSNVLSSNGKENKLLIEWSKKYQIIYIDRRYLNSSYQKKNLTSAKEVIIKNFI